MKEMRQETQTAQSAKGQDANSPAWEKAVHPFPVWRKGVFAFALILGLAGLGLRVMADPSAPTDTVTISVDVAQDTAKTAESGAAIAPHGFAARTAQSSAHAGVEASPLEAAPSAQAAGGFSDTLQTPLGQYLEDWSGPMMQLGFSFVAGFSIGYALAFFLKATALVAGVLLLMLFGLQYVGVVDVNWLGIQSHYDSLIAWAQPHTGSFREFITNNLPSSGMAALGLLTGFRKK